MTSPVHTQQHEDEPLSKEEESTSLEFKTSTQIGKLFTLARRELNVSLHAVAQKIHVRATYLEAIEGGHLDKLPSPLYAAGFIRLYARYVQLDGDEILRRLDLAKENTISHGTLLHATSYLKPNRFALIVSGILTLMSLSLIGFLAWYRPLPPLSQGLDHLQSFMTSPPVLENKIQGELPPQQQTTYDTPKVPPHNEETGPLDAVDKNNNHQGSAEENKNLAEPEVHVTKQTVTFFAHDDCWLDLRKGDTVLFSAVLKRGKTYDISSATDVEISVGNAPSLEIRHGDTIIPPLSRAERVVKHVKLASYIEEYAHTQ